MRGVHGLTFGITTIVQGSSPHARGPRSRRHGRTGRSRIIPACAGSTFFNVIGAPRVQDHPRMRGVHGRVSRNRRAMVGSSPHARGPPCYKTISVPRDGIIPACAGSTPLSETQAMRIQDHPRMRGVHKGVMEGGGGHAGSSPHARGPLRGIRAFGFGAGIIPACAGSTLSISDSFSQRQDHPRMRGVHHQRRQGFWTPSGSSPHARGPHSSTLPATPAPWIIPACAGSTFSLEPSSQ